MSRSVYWALVVAAGLFAFAGVLVLFQSPATPGVPTIQLDDFYRNQYVWAGIIGIVLGAAAGWYATGHTYHQPREHDSDFNHRTAWRGFWTGVAALLLASAVTCAFAASTVFGGLAPLDGVILVMRSGLFAVVLSIAFAGALILYAVVTRSKKWGGQYALIRRV